VIDISDPVPLAVQIKDPTGALADATSVVVTVTDPTGATFTPAVTHPGTGLYQATLTAVLPGLHAVVWQASGANACTYTDAFNVDNQTGIVSLAAVRNHLRVSAQVTDDQLRDLLLLGSELVESYTSRVWRQRTVTEVHDGGCTQIRLRVTPVISVISAFEFGGQVTQLVLDPVAGTLARGTKYGGYFWLPGIQNIQVTYIAGPTSVPWKVRQGCLELIRHLWDTQRGGSQLPKQAGAGDDWDPRTGYSIPRRVAELLDWEKGPGF